MASEADEPIDEREVSFAELSIIEEIGEGTTATVHRGTLRGAVVAVKEIHILNDDTDMAIIQAAQRELRVLSKCTHPNIVHFVGLVVESFPIRLILEYCAGGSLFDLLHNHVDVDLVWDQRFKVLHDTASAELLHPVLDSWTLPHVKLADFGFARLEAAHMTSCVGTKHWMAPEVLAGTAYTTKADVFSFAMMAYEVAFRAVPFSNLDAHDVARRTKMGDRPSFDEPDEEAPEEMRDLIAQCWDQDPDRRPDFAFVRNAVAQAALRAREGA